MFFGQPCNTEIAGCCVTALSGLVFYEDVVMVQR